MKRSITLTVVVLCIIGCGTMRALNLIDTSKLNETQFKKISEISVEDEKGFKYVKTTITNKNFNSVSTTTETQIISKDEHREIKKIIKRYE